MKPLLIILIFFSFNFNAQTKDELKDKIFSLQKENIELKEQLIQKEKQINKLNVFIDSIKKPMSKDLVLIKNPQTKRDTLFNLMVNYLKVENINERLKYVYKPELIKNEYDKYYANGFRTPKISNSDILITILGNEDAFSFVNFDNMNSMKYYFKKTKDGYKIDWLSSFGIDTPSFKEFLTNENLTEGVFRLKLQIVERSSDTSKDFYEANVDWPTFKKVYFQKNLVELYEILKSGNPTSATVKVVKQSSENVNYYIIEKIISKDWNLNY